MEILSTAEVIVRMVISEEKKDLWSTAVLRYMSFDRISDEGKGGLRMVECGIVISFGLPQYLTSANNVRGSAFLVRRNHLHLSEHSSLAQS